MKGDILIATSGIEIPQDKIAAFCRKWKITELALFGSVLREDFGPESDVDVLVSFAPDPPWTLLDQVRMQNDLKQILGRPVDLVTREGIERSRNQFRRREILDSARVFYGA